MAHCRRGCLDFLVSRLRILEPTVPVPGWLNDAQGRRLRYLRLSVTDRCDLKCRYCMPADGVPASPKNEILSIEELFRVVRLFAELGVRTVRLTGGEPLLRKGLDVLIRKIRDELGITDIAMTTNATALRAQAPSLARAGLKRLNVSLDSLQADVFSELTRGGDLGRVLDGIQAAQDAGLDQIKTNTVVIRGHNDSELEDMIQWAWSKNITPRFIELMPLGYGAVYGRARVVETAELVKRLGHLLVHDEASGIDGRGPALYHVAKADPQKRVGFISAVSENFCEQCNRVRITAKGEIRACLASTDGLSLRNLMRREASDARIVDEIRASLYGKKERHGFYLDDRREHHEVSMSRIGG
jgi:cyclic pyranopterin phosphate synthase